MLFPLTIVTLVYAANANPVSRTYPIYPDSRVVDGENAVIESFPYQISLELYGHHSCGGSIVSEFYVVTAGYCAGVPAESLTVRAGSSIQGKGGSVHQVDKIVRHEKYEKNEQNVTYNDVAVLRVKEPFTFDEKCKSIKLYDVDEEAKVGAMGVITGWGKTGQGFPIQLQTVSVPVVSKEICDKAYKSLGGLPEGQICASYYGEGGKDVCVGDSGGPMAIEGRLAGIISWGSGCGEANYPGVFTEIAAYRDWINEHAEL